MIPVYNISSEAIKTVNICERHFAEYNRRKTNQRIRQNIESICCAKQRISGIVMVIIGFVAPFLLNGDGTFSLFALPLGIFLMLTKEKVMTF